MIVYWELSSLERDLGFSTKTLYAVSNSLDKHYRMVQIPKKNGGSRKLNVPDKLLKTIQRRITETLLLPMPISRYATAYYPGSTTLRNARPHVGKPLVLKLDILHFFDSIRYSDVKDRVFPAEIYAEPLRILLTMLCYHKDALPQGAPSSPAITNILMREFDEQIGQWCTQRGIAYTRYCDDLTFSGNLEPGPVIAFVQEELAKRGFLLNTKKTSVRRGSSRQTVTGIVVNEKLRVPADDRRRLRQEMYFIRKFGLEEHLRQSGVKIPPEQYCQQLLGRASYILQISPNDAAAEDARKWILENAFGRK